LAASTFSFKNSIAAGSYSSLPGERSLRSLIPPIVFGFGFGILSSVISLISKSIPNSLIRLINSFNFLTTSFSTVFASFT
jgi:hypothetical protein